MLMYCDLWPKVSKLNSRPLYCSQIYGMLNNLDLWLDRATVAKINFSQKCRINSLQILWVLKYGSEEKGFSLCKCSILLGIFMSKKIERLRSELLSEDKITNLLGFLTK